MTRKDRSRGGQWCSVCFYRSCTTLPSRRSVGKPTVIVVAVQGPPILLEFMSVLTQLVLRNDFNSHQPFRILLATLDNKNFFKQATLTKHHTD